MKKLFKWIFRLFLILFLILVLLVALLILFLDPIAKSLAERQIRQQTGLGVTIGRLSIGLKSPTLAIENLKLLNTAEFGGSSFVDIPELRVLYDLEALRSRKLHLEMMRCNLGELHIVQNKDGKTNLQALQERRKQQESGSGSSAPAVEFQGIDTLTLAIGRLKFTSAKDTSRNEEAYVGYKNETLKNVKSVKDLEPLIARVSLEKNVRFLSENLLQPATGAVPTGTRPAGNESLKSPDGSTDSPPKK